MKILANLKISLLFLVIFSCKENKQNKIRSVFAGDSSRKWYCYSMDETHAFYPYRVKEFFRDGKQIQYINNSSTKQLEKIPKDDMYNPERWFIINDSVVSIESERNPVSGYYHKQNRKILFYNQDSIILQGTKKSEYQSILILTRYKKDNLHNTGKSNIEQTILKVKVNGKEYPTQKYKDIADPRN
ncbi:hypothetical protein ACFO4P_00535 [Epilithonimonas pallida]|uniref:DKNYY family protein n=1 Tax=Epilithonimonas pallida TaxID=373671 RepID=A0ABY1R8V8_9FLAO|nr:hypothetical protein [Epilithonimonas pallida]SMP97448.1 hypothetical protein SAMN05421679_11331 [Epilithonimonas pallida]